MRDGEAAGIGVSLAHLLGEASLQDRVRRGDVRTAAGSREARSSREAGGGPGDGREAGRERVHRHRPASTLAPPQVQAVGHGEALCLALLIRGMGEHLLGRVLAKEGKCCF